MEYSPKKIVERLDKHQFQFKKKFGQNFIIDENIVNKIVEKSEIDKETLVIEIGPGSGSLTNKLAQVAKNVLCYEVDVTLKELLKESFSNQPNVDFIFKDFLKADVIKDIKNYNYEKLYVVANLPYNITTPIVIKLIEDKIPVEKIVIMVQKEVGDRFSAKPGTKDYNSLSLFVNYYFDIKKILDVSRYVFVPKPNVDSIVVEFNKRVEKPNVRDEELFFQLIRDSFKQKRKTLKNNLINYDLEKIEKVLKNYNFNSSVRAEQLSIDIFIDIANELSVKT